MGDILAYNWLATNLIMLTLTLLVGFAVGKTMAKRGRKWTVSSVKL